MHPFIPLLHQISPQNNASMSHKKGSDIGFNTNGTKAFHKSQNGKKELREKSKKQINWRSFISLHQQKGKGVLH